VIKLRDDFFRVDIEDCFVGVSFIGKTT